MVLAPDKMPRLTAYQLVVSCALEAGRSIWCRPLDAEAGRWIRPSGC